MSKKSPEDANVQERLASEVQVAIERLSRCGVDGLETGPVLSALGVPDGPFLIAAGGHDGNEEARSSEKSEEKLLADSVGTLELQKQLGVGGMGRVFEARDRELARNVAVKVMTPDLRGDIARLRRFVHEARIAAQLDHPNIVAVHRIGLTEDGRVYFVMKRVEGESLGDILDALRAREPGAIKRYTRHRLLTMFVQVCQAVAYAHERGVLHRDLKPDNIMIGAFGQVFVMDWGVAGIMGNAEERVTEVIEDEQPEDSEQFVATMSRTLDGAVIGTPSYMSPEQASGAFEELDRRSDVWSLGTILFELLTWKRAFAGPSSIGVMLKVVSEPPPNLRELYAGDGNRIPEELCDICHKALAKEKDGRQRDAHELGNEVQAFLEGSKRREEATQRIVEARILWNDHRALGREFVGLRDRERQLNERTQPWAPIEQKAELLAVRDRLIEVEPERARVFGEFVATCEKALAHDPDNTDARALLADGWWERLQEAEGARNLADVAYFTDRLRTYDDGRYRALLEGTGSITLDSEPTGATVYIEQFSERSLVWAQSEQRILGETPLMMHPLPMGSYRLTIEHPKHLAATYPVHIARGGQWRIDEKLVLLEPAAIPEGFVYVPAGPFRAGGDSEAPGFAPASTPHEPGFLVAILPVTVAQYLEWLNAMHQEDPLKAWSHVPRSETSLSDSEGQYLRRPESGEQYELPHEAFDGLAWDENWPVFGVSWNDCIAYAAWRSLRDGRRYSIPTERQWEKAARGVDGRAYPWGDGFDATLCKMGESRQQRPHPEAVGTFAGDVSVYGVRDMAGSMREWCADAAFDGDGMLRPVRGGSWNYDARFCRVCCRLGRAPERVFAYTGFRLVCAIPTQGDALQ